MGKQQLLEQSSSTKRKKKQQLPVNPNWALLQLKLKSNGAKHSKHFDKFESQNPDSILGKRKERPGSKFEDSSINPLIPTSTDCSLTDVIAMDCEMVGVGANKSALGRVTLVNRWGNVLYDEFVRPVERVVDFRTEVSGIRPRDLRKAKNFQAVQNRVAEVMKGRIIVGHALHNDLKALLLGHPKKDIRDTSVYLPFLKEGRKRALKHLAEDILGIKIQDGEHCSIEDARAAMLLYMKNRKAWEKTMKGQTRNKEIQKKRKQKN